MFKKDNFEDQRADTRVDFCVQHRILHLEDNEEFTRNVVISRNFSSSGVCFRAPQTFEIGGLCLLNLSKEIFDQLDLSERNIIHNGDYFLGKVVWNQKSPFNDDQFYAVGCNFLDHMECSQDMIDYFTYLMNRDMLRKLSGLT